MGTANLVVELIVSAIALASVVILGRSWPAPTWRSPVRMRLIVFALGAATGVLPAMFRLNLATLTLDAIIDGIAWLVFFEISGLVWGRWQSRTIVSLAALTAIVWVLEAPVAVVLYGVFSFLSGRGPFDLEASLGLLSSAFQILGRYPYNLYNLIDAVTIVGVSYSLNGGAAFGRPSRSMSALGLG